MAELKTKKMNTGVKEFLAAIPDEAVRNDCQTLTNLMRKITGDPGDMWGSSIAGFGNYRIKYADGHEEDWPALSFAPRKQNLTIYLALEDIKDKDELLAKLGKHKVSGRTCLYIKRLSDVDLQVLEELLRRATFKGHGRA